MKLLWEIGGELTRRLRQAGQVFLFSDFDGTLSPISPNPYSACLPPETKNLLLKLCSIPRFTLAIISGRSLQNIKELIGIDSIHYVGNHGLEILTYEGRWTPPEAEKFRPLITKLEEELATRLKIPGIILENKGLSLAIHWRLVPEEHLEEIASVLKKVLLDGLCLRAGKKAYEIRPEIDWDKGAALLYLRNKLSRGDKELLFYLGDDLTDENAFRVLNKEDVGILVGQPRESFARYYLPQDEVVKFLSFLKDVYRNS